MTTPASTPTSHADPDGDLSGAQAGTRPGGRLDSRGEAQLLEARTAEANSRKTRNRRLGIWNRFMRLHLPWILLGLPVLLVTLYFVGRVLYAVLSVSGQNVAFGLLIIGAIAVQIGMLVKFGIELYEVLRKQRAALSPMWNAAWLVELLNGLAVAGFTFVYRHELIKVDWMWQYAVDLLIAAALLLLWQIILIWRDRDSKRHTFGGLFAMCLVLGFVIVAAFSVGLGYSTNGSGDQPAARGNAAAIAPPATQNTAQEGATSNTVASGSTHNFSFTVTGACPGPYVLTITNLNKSGGPSNYRVRINDEKEAIKDGLAPGASVQYPVPANVTWLAGGDKSHHNQTADVTPKC